MDHNRATDIKMDDTNQVTVELLVDSNSNGELVEDALEIKHLLMTSNGITTETYLQGNLPTTGLYPVWSKTHSTQEDVEAARVLLKLMNTDTIRQKLNDKSVRRKTVYMDVALKLEEMGIYLGDGDKAEKVCNKFKNLGRGYKEYVKAVKTAGNSRKDPPNNYDLLHALFGGTHAIDSVPSTPQRSTSSFTPGPPSIHSFRPIRSSLRISSNSVKEGSPPIGPSSPPPLPSLSRESSPEIAVSICEEEPEYASAILTASYSPVMDAPRTTSTISRQSKHEQLMSQFAELQRLESERHAKSEQAQEERCRRLEQLLEKHHNERLATMNRLIMALTPVGEPRKRKRHESDSD